MSYPSIKTPLVDVTKQLSLPFKVLFKQENRQPSGSFKLRGIGYLIGKSIDDAKKLGKQQVEVFSSSGGNAGLAAAYSSKFYNVKCTVTLPKFAKASVIKDLEHYGAKVILHGEHWGQADEYLRNTIMGQLDDSIYPVYCHPFDHPTIWTGHSELVNEIESQLSPSELSNVKGVICSVGGGGLFNGVIEGLKKSQHLTQVPVLAVETDGAPTFHQAIQQNKVVHLESVKTLATSLASPYISAKSLENYHDHPVKNVLIPDLDSVKGTVFYNDVFNDIVEPACGASIAMVSQCSQHLDAFGKLSNDDIIIVVVCGGTVTNKEDLDNYRTLIH